jgi:DNA-binding response OmpR family regulator
MTERAVRVLVVDGDEGLRSLLRHRLGAQRFDVVEAADAETALAEIARQTPDVLVTELALPGMDGWELLRRLRRGRATAALPMLVLSARNRPADVAGGLEAGADDYLGKPFEFPELLARLRALLRRARGYDLEEDADLPRGRVITFVGAKGGVGTTTLAVNVGVALALEGTATILADLRPVRGTVAAQLGLAPRRRVDRLPLGRPEVMTRGMVDGTLVDHPSGLRLLLGPSGEQEAPAAAALRPLVDLLRTLAEVVILDVDGIGSVWGEAGLRAASRILVVTEPEPLSLDRAGAVIGLLEHHGVRPGRIEVVANQTHPTMTVGAAEIEERTGRAVGFALPAMAQACAEAVRRGQPLVRVAPHLPGTLTIQAIAAAIKPPPPAEPRVGDQPPGAPGASAG